MLLQNILKKVKATIDAVRSPPSIETHRALALLAARSITEKVFVQPNEPTFRVFQRAASRLLVNTSPLTSGDLVVKPSSIPGSGNGVFANRSFATGETLTLYPGCIYSSLSVPSLETSAFDSVRETDHSLLLPPAESAYAALRYDGVHIDALNVANIDVLKSACSNHFNGLKLSSALGHIIQHCGNVIPNSITIPVDFFVLEGHEGGLITPNDIDDETARATFFVPPYGSRGRRSIDAQILPWSFLGKLPYWRAESSTFSGALPKLDENNVEETGKRRRRACVIPALMVVAAQNINKGDELFQDYALSGETTPAWYIHVTSDMRWELHSALKRELAQ